MNFYEFSQNNTGGSFIVNDKVCHRLIIEAESVAAATQIAENLGCYWDGVHEGQDCPCCGDRWYEPSDIIDLDKINNKWNGWEVSEWITEKNIKNKTTENTIITETTKLLKTKFKGMTWLDGPVSKKESWGSYRIVGRLRIDSIEQYAQLMADLYGWTNPDVRIFYADGTVKEIFSNKVSR